MSKPIKLTAELIAECRAAFEKLLADGKFADGKVSFTKTFESVANRKAEIIYTPEAWEKQNRLVAEFSDEVAWYGVSRRGDDPEKDEYIVSDIVVYPQTVTGSTVDMDTERVATWMMEHSEDERFGEFHLQGHSHVNMGTTPSGTDIGHQQDILAMLPEGGFYIFVIWNKSGQNTCKIYDLGKNVLFEDADITVSHLTSDDVPFIPQTEAGFARACGAGYVSRGAESDMVSLWSDMPTYDIDSGEFSSEGLVGVVKACAFPSVKAGECVKVPEDLAGFIADAKKIVERRTYSYSYYGKSGYQGGSYGYDKDKKPSYAGVYDPLAQSKSKDKDKDKPKKVTKFDDDWDDYDRWDGYRQSSMWSR